MANEDLYENLDEAEEEDDDFGVISFKTIAEIERSIVESPFRAIYQTNNFLLPQLGDLVDEERTVNLRPEYQRRSRWTNKQRSLLIESFLLNVPVPPIFLFEGDLARYEVMDGQQRLLAIKEFFANQYKLSSLTVLAPLNGRRYDDLPSRTKRTLDRASLSAIVLLKESRSALRDSASKRVLELRKFVFERLNTGGKRLNPQEIRNAIYNSDFNRMVVELTREPLFTTIWNIPPYSEEFSESDYESPERKKNGLYKTMADCQIVLRFFALRDSSAIRGSMRSILDKCMEGHLHSEERTISALRERFGKRLALANELFDAKPFRLGKGENDRPSMAMYDAVMVATDRLWKQREQLIANRKALQKSYWLAIDSPEKIKKFTGRANTSADVKARIDAMEAVFKSVL